MLRYVADQILHQFLTRRIQSGIGFLICQILSGNDALRGGTGPAMIPYVTAPARCRLLKGPIRFGFGFIFDRSGPAVIPNVVDPVWYRPVTCLLGPSICSLHGWSGPPMPRYRADSGPLCGGSGPVLLPYGSNLGPASAPYATDPLWQRSLKWRSRSGTASICGGCGMYAIPSLPAQLPFAGHGHGSTLGFRA